MNEEETKKFIEIIDTIKKIRISKSHDYGTSWKVFGLNGILYQIRSKFVRLMNLTTKGKSPMHESLRDTLLDMANYSIMGVQLIDMGLTEDEFEKLLDIKEITK